jgi:very-short-patch-repair endonuclease
MKMLKMGCAWCGKSFESYKGEVTRWLKQGRDYFFCSRSCGTAHSNEVSGKKQRPLEKVCPVCTQTFLTHTGKGESTFCSRSCASRGSVTPLRRQRAAESGKKNLKTGGIKISAAQLYAREKWKYESLEKFLIKSKVPYQFEFYFTGGKYVFDLALLNKNLLIEFDGRYHEGSIQRKEDKKKDREAIDRGWRVVRLPVTANTRIRPSVLFDILKK